jgi:hypothetical protein
LPGSLPYQRINEEHHHRKEHKRQDGQGDVDKHVCEHLSPLLPVGVRHEPESMEEIRPTQAESGSATGKIWAEVPRAPSSGVWEVYTRCNALKTGCTREGKILE